MKIKFTLTSLLFLAVHMLMAQSRATTGPIISEYIEGSSNNKALEIFNNTALSIDPTDCVVEVYANGSTVPTSIISLTGTILFPLETYVIAHSSSADSIIFLADQTSFSCNWNGDDAIAIKCNGEITDILGEIGVDPGASWLLPSGSTTQDHTLRRDSMVTAGELSWSTCQNQWFGFAGELVSDLGQHIMYVPVSINENTKTSEVIIYPNPTHNTFTISFNEELRMQNAELMIYDVTGRVVHQTTVNTKRQTLNTNLLPGIYFVKVMDGERVFTEKVVVE
jgi:hypothetical protein